MTDLEHILHSVGSEYGQQRHVLLARTRGRKDVAEARQVAMSSLDGVLASFHQAGVQILTIYERPSKKTLDTHRYLIEVAGHAAQGKLAAFVQTRSDIRVLGSYPRK